MGFGQDFRGRRVEVASVMAEGIVADGEAAAVHTLTTRMSPITVISVVEVVGVSPRGTPPGHRR